MSEKLLTEKELREIESGRDINSGYAQLKRLIADHRRMREAILAIDFYMIGPNSKVMEIQRELRAEE